MSSKVVKKENIEIQYIRLPEFQEEYITGVQGIVTPYDFRLSFYKESIPNKLVEKKDSGEKLVVRRESKIGVIMSYKSLLELKKLLDDQLKIIEERQQTISDSNVFT